MGKTHPEDKNMTINKHTLMRKAPQQNRMGRRSLRKGKRLNRKSPQQQGEPSLAKKIHSNSKTRTEHVLSPERTQSATFKKYAHARNADPLRVSLVVSHTKTPSSRKAPNSCIDMEIDTT
ncbi:hypothetical protein SESBI_24670 [Sesbania bispinosa]|nr:hypothetical protein SESBI_24670 [Sesbania bispinosa]